MSETLRQDPINNAIYGEHGIKQGIKAWLEKKCWTSAIILTYSGIDAMARLAMPEKQKDVKRKDFVQWCDKYIRFSDKNRPTGLEMYSARCGMLHSHSIKSKLTRSGTCREIGYSVGGYPEIRYQKDIASSLMLISIEALAREFFHGIDRFLPLL